MAPTRILLLRLADIMAATLVTKLSNEYRSFNLSSRMNLNAGAGTSDKKEYPPIYYTISWLDVKVVQFLLLSGMEKDDKVAQARSIRILRIRAYYTRKRRST